MKRLRRKIYLAWKILWAEEYSVITMDRLGNTIAAADYTVPGRVAMRLTDKSDEVYRLMGAIIDEGGASVVEEAKRILDGDSGEK
jgi:hypothetical protein